MKHNFYKQQRGRYMALFALLMVAIFGSNQAMAIELDTVWVSDINGSVLSQHSVSKNIFISNNGITEIYHQDGKLVKTFPLSGSCIEFSPDGNKVLYCAPDGIRVFNITTLEDVLTITTKYWYPKFLGNEKIVFLSVEKNPELGIYDLNTKKVNTYPYENKGLTALSASPDGKYISYATYEENNGSDSRAYLYLLDAETMKQVKELGSWDSEGQRIQDITFSPNSQYLTYNIYYSNSTPINIYDVQTKSIYKSLNWSNFFYNSAGFEFLGNYLYIQKGTSSDLNKYEFGIYKFGSNELIYKVNQLNDFLYYSKLNLNNNHLTYNDRLFNIVCVNFKNIISSIPQFISIKVMYNNNILTINNTEKPISNISIMTIEGREVYRQNFLPSNTNNPIEIPLELSNGLYLVNILSGSENFNYKLLIKE